MSKNWKATKAYVKANAVVDDVIQRKPYTWASIICKVDGIEHIDFAFAKVTWPDRWNPEEGIRLCKDKASALIAKKLLKEGYKVTFDTFLDQSMNVVSVPKMVVRTL